MDEEVKEPEKPVLMNSQIRRLLDLTRVMREDITTLETVLEIKKAILADDCMLAKQLHDELPMNEQRALWVAPKFGGIFTTDERDIVRHGVDIETIKQRRKRK